MKENDIHSSMNIKYFQFIFSWLWTFPRCLKSIQNKHSYATVLCFFFHFLINYLVISNDSETNVNTASMKLKLLWIVFKEHDTHVFDLYLGKCRITLFNKHQFSTMASFCAQNDNRVNTFILQDGLKCTVCCIFVNIWGIKYKWCIKRQE